MSDNKVRASTQQRKNESSRSHGQRPPQVRRRATSRDILNQKLAEMGSYTKYLAGVQKCPFQVKLRCPPCGRSRNMAWMFLCTYCVTGSYERSPSLAKSPNDSKSLASPLSMYSLSESLESDEVDKKKEKEEEPIPEGEQRAFLSCDLCAQKLTESYFCPHCLNAYPGHFVKQYTRCPRCVSCPICTSPLEKIVYAASNDDSRSKSSTEKSDDKTDKNTNENTKDDKLKSPSPNSKSESKDTYLYQCPYCFWSSDTVKLRAEDRDGLLNKLNDMIKTPLKQASNQIDQIKKLYELQNEKLKNTIEKQYVKSRSLGFSGLSSHRRSMFGNRGMRNSNAKKNLYPPQQKVSRHRRNPTMNPEESSKLEELEKKLREKNDSLYLNNKPLPENKPEVEPQTFQSYFELRRFAPLTHKLNNPLHQEISFRDHMPQKYHLMTKESFKCPTKFCNSYVCKPTLRGRGANYEVRTAVLDYLPRVTIKVVKGNLSATGPTRLAIRLQNRHIQEVKFTIDTSINDSKDDDDDEDNEDYNISTVKVTGVDKNQIFEMDAVDIYTKPNVKQRDVKLKNDAWIRGRDCGFFLTITPLDEYYGHDIRFSIKFNYETNMQTINEEKKKKGPLKYTKFSFVLDYHLGRPKMMKILNGKHKSRKSNELKAPPQKV